MRSIILILSFIIVSKFCFAQNSDKHLLNVFSKVGIQAGGPIYHSNTIVEKKGSPGFNPVGGLGVLFKLNKDFNLAFEFIYSRRKINYTSEVKEQFYIDKQTTTVNNEPVVFDIQTTFTGNTKGSFDIQYLELPLLLQYKISGKINVEAGAYYAWAFSRKNTGKATGIVGRSDIDNPSRIDNRPYDNSSHVNLSYWGLVSGVQYKLNPRANIDFRVTYSFTSLYNKNWEGVDYSLKDLYGQLSLNLFLYKN